MTLAEKLSVATSAFLRGESELERLLDSLFDRWSDFAHHRLQLDVYGVTPAPAAVDALCRAGFISVCLHEHDAGEFKACSCRTRSCVEGGQS